MIVVAPHRVAMPVPFIAPCDDGYRFAKRQRKSAIHESGKSANDRPFRDSTAMDAPPPSDSIHRAT
jgi:hypothetical protein